MELFRTHLFLIPLIVMVLTECAKMVTEHIRTGHWAKGMFQPGGFPSTHSAFVTSLLIVLGHTLGPTSPEFAIAFVFACVVWYDAVSLRRSVGEQAELLNRLQHWHHLRERVGHSLKEVAAGIVFGGIVTTIGIWLSTVLG